MNEVGTGAVDVRTWVRGLVFALLLVGCGSDANDAVTGLAAQGRWVLANLPEEPAWMSDRAEVDDCGTAEVAAGWEAPVRCFRSAFEDGRPAELTLVGVLGNGDGFVEVRQTTSDGRGLIWTTDVFLPCVDPSYCGGSTGEESAAQATVVWRAEVCEAGQASSRSRGWNVPFDHHLATVREPCEEIERVEGVVSIPLERYDAIGRAQACHVAGGQRC